MKIVTRTAKLLLGVAMAASLVVPRLMPAVKSVEKEAKAPEKIPWVWGYGGGKLYYREGSTKDKPGGTKWVIVETPQELVSIAASAGGTLWVVTTGGDVLYRQSITFNNLKGSSWLPVLSGAEKFNKIAVGNLDRVYAIKHVDTQKSFAWTYRRVCIDINNPLGTGWEMIQNSDSKRAIGFFKDSVANPMRLAAMGDEAYGVSDRFAQYGLSRNKIHETIYMLAPDQGKWLDVYNGGVKQWVAVDKDRNVWSVDYDNQLWVSAPPPSSMALAWQPIVDKNIRYVACGPTGEVWVLRTSGIISRMTGRAAQIPFNVLWEDVDPVSDPNVQLEFFTIGAIESARVEEKTAVVPSVATAPTKVQQPKAQVPVAKKPVVAKKVAKKPVAKKQAGKK
jgi:hypothetical protein